MKISHVYTRVTGCRVTYMKIRRKGSRTDPGNGLVMVGSGSGGAYTSNNALLALWLEVVDKVYEAK